MSMAIVDKRRPKPNSSEVSSIIGDVQGKRVILLDDMVDTAGSLCGAAKALVELGGATEVSPAPPMGCSPAPLSSAWRRASSKRSSSSTPFPASPA